MSPIKFFFNDVSFSLSERTRLKAFLLLIFKENKKKLESLSIIFCSDNYLLSINQQFLKHDYYTDIITFDLSAAQQPTVGEIYISIDRVKENASISKSTFTKELHRVIFHGVLHLCGFKDKNPVQLKKMRGEEDKYLAKYF